MRGRRKSVKQRLSDHCPYRVIYGGQPFVLLPETSDEWSPPDIWEMVQGINWFCNQNGGKWAFPFFWWWFSHHTPSIYRVSRNKKAPTHKRNLVCSPSRSDLVVQSSRFFFRISHREIYNLGMISGPVLLKMKGKCWMFILLGLKKQKWTEQIDEVGRMLVPEL